MIATWFGAIDDATTDVTTNVQAAVNVMKNNDSLHFPVTALGSASYKFTDTINIPLEKNLRFTGPGQRTVELRMFTTAKPMFKYARTTGKQPSVVSFDGLMFQLNGNPKTAGSYAIQMMGFDDNAANTYLRVYNCFFYGFERAIYSKWTGQSHVVSCFFQANTVSIYLERGASFWHFRDIMSFDDTLVYADDPLADGYSNGLFFDSCNNINATNINLRILGWQSVYIGKCGWDLGSGGEAAIYLNKCMDVTVDSCYISSNGGATTRKGVVIIDSPRVFITKNRIVNNRHGINASSSIVYAQASIIDGNEFDGNIDNDIIFVSNMTACKITNNHFAKQMSRTSTNYEIYVDSVGSNYNIVCFNSFRGSSYTITAGANSAVGTNIFATPAG